MHPDEAVQLALNDLRSRAPNNTPAAARPHAPNRALDLLRAYLLPLRWYVTDGRTPVAGDEAGTGHLPRPRWAPESAEPALDALLPLAGTER
jgi:hypothetical protein